MSLNAGVYIPSRATPGAGGEKLVIKSVPQADGIYVANLTKDRKKLFCGYPTNFGKKGKNLYHQYHIVSLLYLARESDLDDATRHKMIEYAHLWMTYTEQHQKKGDHFIPYEKILKTLNSHKFNAKYQSWDELLQWSKEQ